MNNIMFQSAADFNARLNIEAFTNIEKSFTSEQLQLQFGNHLVLEKAVVDAFMSDLYSQIGGEIVKGKFNDTPEVNALFEKAKSDLMELKKVKYQDESRIREVFVMKAKEGISEEVENFQKAKDSDLGNENPFIKDNIEKGRVSDAFEYSSLIIFKKSGKDIKEKISSQTAAIEASIAMGTAQLEMLSKDMTVFPTEKMYQWGRGAAISCSYLKYHYCLTDHWEGRDLNQVYCCETGQQVYPSATAEDCVPYRTWNDLVSKWYDDQKELQLIKLFQENFDDSEKYELSAEQMLVLGF